MIELKPSLKGDTAKGFVYVDLPYELSYQEIHGDEVWSGYMKGKMHVTDGRSWLQQHWRLVVRLAILALILFIVAGYVPGIKPYLPRRIRRRPRIDCSPMSLFTQPYVAHGAFTKDFFTTIIPYIPEKGSLRYAPSGVPGAPSLKLKATHKRNSILVTNGAVFAGKPKVLFNGAPVDPQNRKPFTIGVGTVIEVSTEDMNYTCQMTMH